MGDALVSVLVKEVLGRLTSLALQEFGILWGLKNDILTLKQDFEQIEAVLQDAEEKHIKEKAVELWLKSLRSASLMVENVLDMVSTQALLNRLYKQSIKYRVRAFFSSNLNMFMSRVRIAHKVKNIRRKLDYIASKRFELKLTPSGVISHVDDVGVEMPDRETSSFIHDSSVILGRDKEVELVAGKICSKDIGKYENGEILVYGIWGMGGLGKTTLAQLVYNHEKVNGYFNLKCWVYVSENFHVQEIMKKLIESIDKCGCTLTQLETLQESLQNKLRGKQFLIVLDDVWIEYSEKPKWDQLSKILSCGVEGSIVVMTTRSQSTCQLFAMVPELQHNLGYLSEEDSWLLFKKLAFAQGRKGDEISELEPIGRGIVEKCKGLPLAVKTLGSLMFAKSSISEWQYVKDNNIWESEENEVLPALKLSYDNLLPHIKRCFAYYCLFPKGHVMDKGDWITLWVSNGFIPPRREIDLYVLGEEVFICLIWRSFFIVNVDYGSNMYLMHDLIYDMARHVMGDDCLFVNLGKEIIIPNEALHLSSSYPNFHLSPQELGKLTSLRSIFMFRKRFEGSFRQISSHVYLRVLYLSGIQLKTLPGSICKLQHLRYLNLSLSSIEVLCESIIYLQNLQVLLLNGCVCLYKLPDGIRYMRNLQRLDITNCYSLNRLPCGIKELTGLRRLPWFPVCNLDGAKIGELENLNLLEGELYIDRLENVGGLSEAKSANLKSKTNLSALVFNWSSTNFSERIGGSFAHDEEVLEGLEPNSSLKKLSIYYYSHNIISPSWMVNLRNLVEIRFWFCRNCEYIPALGRLPNLKIIHLERMNSLKYFHHDDTNMVEDTTDMFLCLHELYIEGCPKLVSLPSNLPKLEVLSLGGCRELVSLPDEIESFKDLNELVILECKHLWERYNDVDKESQQISFLIYISFCSHLTHVMPRIIFILSYSQMSSKNNCIPDRFPLL